MSKNGFVTNKRCCIGLGCPPKVTKEGMLGNLFDQWVACPRCNNNVEIII